MLHVREIISTSIELDYTRQQAAVKVLPRARLEPFATCALSLSFQTRRGSHLYFM